jgi:signal transduction histidine kinase
VTLRFAVPGEHITALACPGHLDQILDNLLANALDATPADGEVSILAERSAGHVDVHVVDTGRGMSAPDRARAFDRFWRSEGAPRDGTGLGLAIVAQLVRVSGGTIRLDPGAWGGIDAVVRLEAP